MKSAAHWINPEVYKIRSPPPSSSPRSARALDAVSPPKCCSQLTHCCAKYDMCVTHMFGGHAQEGGPQKWQEENIPTKLKST